MTDNFASYAAATATVDRDGIGRTAAAKEFAKLLLDKDGSTLLEIPVEEAAKLGDAATRSLLRQVLVESSLAKIVSGSLLAPRDALDRSEQLASILPLEHQEGHGLLACRPPEARGRPPVPDVGGREDTLHGERTAGVFWGETRENNRLRGAIADNLSDGASIIPSIPDFTPGLRGLVDDAETREFVKGSSCRTCRRWGGGSAPARSAGRPTAR